MNAPRAPLAVHTGSRARWATVCVLAAAGALACAAPESAATVTVYAGSDVADASLAAEITTADAPAPGSDTVGVGPTTLLPPGEEQHGLAVYLSLAALELMVIPAVFADRKSVV